MTPQELKNSILQLAIQGKLVEQRPEEGTGEELYRQIQAEKQKLIREGKIKKEKPLPDIAEDEVPFDIPENWKWVRMSSVISLLSGSDLTPDKYNSREKGIPYITGASNIENGIVYIIGMMNTADRSLAMIDYALRRRFSFFEIEPGFDSEGFIHYQNGLNNETLNELVSKVKELNREIAADKSLGKGFCIGHSYFCGKDVCTDEWLHSIVDYDILPMLSEYWFDDTSKLRRWENILQGMFQ